ncbi:hypothetical protein QOZ80_6AG0526490 [Eleusine coracana subsp. coracana]|nr:hypothetical protein QOZ80_6AG0526490 [Eleusine coracana subsp. coracana]
MAAASSAAFFGLGDTQMQPQAAASALQQNSAAPAPAASAGAAPPKKKRNQPGNPNPDAEVIALSPRTLLATNRFVCEVCGKGFQREQNLQLHRRGHNLPWKLKQKNPKETRRKVYLCPEPTCVHHDPSRALGDLTGIKKHFCRKHGEKKWKCDKCNKRYAVQSDWKAHSKTCGTREYRRDSFITHRAFCDALARESAQLPPLGSSLYVGTGGMALGVSGPAPHQMSVFGDHQAQSSSAAAAAQFDHIIPSSSSSSMFRSQASGSSSSFFLGGGGPSSAQDFSEDGDHSQGSQSSLLHGKTPGFHGLMQLPEQNQQGGNGNGNILNLGFFNNSSSGQDARLVMQDQQYNNGGGSSNAEQQRSMIASLGNNLSSNFTSLYNNPSGSSAGGPPQNSATALLLKAAQMGSTSSNNHNSTSALLRAAGFGANGQQGNRAAGEGSSAANDTHFHELIMNSLAGGSGSSGFSGGVRGLGGVDDGKLSTRDFLGVGRGSVAPLGLHIGALDPAQMK